MKLTFERKYIGWGFTPDEQDLSILNLYAGVGGNRKLWEGENPRPENRAGVSSCKSIKTMRKQSELERLSTLHIPADSVVYISGAISSDPDFRKKFELWELRILAVGAKRVLNPAKLPDGWEYEEYMEHCLLMVRRASMLVLLPCWKHSPGARAEKAYAESLNRRIVDFSELIKETTVTQKPDGSKIVIRITTESQERCRCHAAAFGV